ncbi:hypothetical protein BDW31_1017 [Staphylococcus sp. AtHG25]|nr:hypothetical protein BDW31_1017 [Staphylococcus sp. AtHG25]
MNIAVVGAGVTGLAAAARLAAKVIKLQYLRRMNKLEAV